MLPFRTILFALGVLFLAGACNSTGGGNGGNGVTQASPTPTPTPTQVTLTGQLDTSFGTNGLSAITGSASDTALSLGVQSTGKMLLLFTNTNASNVTSYDIARYGADGAFDAGFGASGILVTGCADGGGATCLGVDLTVQSDDKFIFGTRTAAIATAEASFTRLSADGVVDASYGTSGTTAPISTLNVFPFLDTVDGNLDVASTGNASAMSSPALSRFTTSGVLDSGFGTSGSFSLATVGSLSGTPTLNGAVFNAVNHDEIVFGSLSTSFFIEEITNAGALDTAFASTGYKVFSGYNSLAAVGVQSDGKILAEETVGDNVEVTRFLAAGTVDSTGYGTSGKATIAYPATPFGKKIFVDKEGKAVVIVNTVMNPYISRLTTAGVLDSSFGTGGTFTLPLGLTVVDAAFVPDGELALAVESISGAQILMVK